MRFFVDSLIGLSLIGLLIGVLLYHRKQQRLLIDSLIALLLVGVLASVLFYRWSKKHNLERYRVVQEALSALSDQAEYQGVLASGDSGVSRFPAVMSPLWFRSGLPMNVAIPGWHPWMDVAPPGDTSEHPPDPVITDSGQAGIWYNPNLGIFRARVQEQGSELESLNLYNQLNKTTLQAIHPDPGPARQPQPLRAVLTTANATVESSSDHPDPAISDSVAPAGRAMMTRPIH